MSNCGWGKRPKYLATLLENKSQYSEIGNMFKTVSGWQWAWNRLEPPSFYQLILTAQALRANPYPKGTDWFCRLF